MVKTKRNKVISVPIRLLLTERGVDHFLKSNQPLSRFRLSNAQQEYGVELRDFTPATVQKMMRLDFVGKIELAVTDIAENRAGLIDFTKLVIYGMLYRQFDTEIFEALMESDLVRTWNRHNAKNPIDFQTNVNTAYLQRTLQRNPDGVAAMKRDVLEEVFRNITRSTTLITEEKRLHSLIAERFLDTLGPLTQFLLVAHRGSPSYHDMTALMQHRLTSYLQKTSVAEYLALMLLEVLTSLKHGGSLVRGRSPDNGRRNGDDAYGPRRAGVTTADPDGARAGSGVSGEHGAPGASPSDAEVDAECGAEAIGLLWKIRRHSRTPGDRGRLHLVISNRHNRFEEVKHAVNDRANHAVNRKSLNDFYLQDPEAADSNSLGLYYLSFLHEACRKVGIHFESFVHNVPEEDRTMVNLVLHF